MPQLDAAMPDAAMPTPFPLRLLSQQRGCSRCSVPISWRSPLPGIYSSIYLKQGGGVFRLAECLEDSYCSSTIIFPHTRPHISTNLISRFLLSTLAAEAWRSNAGSAKFRGPVVWFILNTVVVVRLKHWCGSP